MVSNDISHLSFCVLLERLQILMPKGIFSPFAKNKVFQNDINLYNFKIQKYFLEHKSNIGITSELHLQTVLPVHSNSVLWKENVIISNTLLLAYQKWYNNNY